jgi:hyperosmotically inducible protein
VKLNDSEVKNAIMTALFKERISDINVDVNKGEVSITGVVDVLNDKVYVEKVIRKIPGVKKIENNLVISTDGELNDAEITEMLLNKLAHYPNLEQIGVEIHKGVVLLKGWIRNAAQEQAAIELAGKVLGVKEVISNLKMQQDVEKDSATLVNEIERAISLEEKLDSQDIRVEINDGKVILEGQVDNALQAQKAEKVVAAIDGVKKVYNHLEITRGNNIDTRLTNRLRKILAQQPDINEKGISAIVVAGNVYLNGEVFTSGAKKTAETLASSLPGVNRVINNIEIIKH